MAEGRVKCAGMAGAVAVAVAAELARAVDKVLVWRGQ